jgi:GFO/IDH/MocA oxidoreductase family protein
MKNFLHAIDTRSKPVATVEEGYISTASCILANIAMKLGRTLVWDNQRQQVVDDSEANQLLARPYRRPWRHPHPINV